MAERAHLSIGEVLSLLQDEFPDITISKIRFLESQGLLDPERTPSGYRKFYEGDIDRLRWILRQQREHFLPLKVIKDRLADGGPLPTDDLPAGEVTPAEPSTAAPATARRATDAAPSIFAELREQQRADAPPAKSRPAVPSPAPAGNPLDGGPSAISLTFEELAEAAGILSLELRELQRFGLIEGRQVGADTYYDGDALVIARTAAGFIRNGLEARHLRMYKVAAEREAGFFEQVVMPLLKQRNPAARQQAADTLGELAGMGEQLHAALLRHALRDHTGGR
jgi:DNA-binding transcriptional MerR regulator